MVYITRETDDVFVTALHMLKYYYSIMKYCVVSDFGYSTFPRIFALTPFSRADQRTRSLCEQKDFNKMSSHPAGSDMQKWDTHQAG